MSVSASLMALVLSLWLGKAAASWGSNAKISILARQQVPICHSFTVVATVAAALGATATAVAAPVEAVGPVMESKWQGWSTRQKNPLMDATLC